MLIIWSSVSGSWTCMFRRTFHTIQFSIVLGQWRLAVCSGYRFSRTQMRYLTFQSCFLLLVPRVQRFHQAQIKTSESLSLWGTVNSSMGWLGTVEAVGAQWFWKSDPRETGSAAPHQIKTFFFPRLIQSPIKFMGIFPLTSANFRRGSFSWCVVMKIRGTRFYAEQAT